MYAFTPEKWIARRLDKYNLDKEHYNRSIEYFKVNKESFKDENRNNKVFINPEIIAEICIRETELDIKNKKIKTI
jgi:hypothetical protein